MVKPAYPYTKEQDQRSDVLMTELQQLQKREEEIKRELKSIIYSVEMLR